MGFQVMEDKDGQWRWKLEDGYTEIAESSVGYDTQDDCVKAIAKVMATTYETSTTLIGKRPPLGSFDVQHIDSIRVPIPFGETVRDEAPALLDLTISAIALTVADAYSREPMPQDADALSKAILTNIQGLLSSARYLGYREKLQGAVLNDRLLDKISTYREAGRPGPLER